ncbi:MAG: HAD-IC family P-type ATPase, partial [Chloroflexi bacterium]|nr:HAD-IC family P-type ATPase [Chloroflexota bacterium]
MSRFSFDQAWHTLSTEHAMRELQTDIQHGLKDHEAARRLIETGPNELEERRGAPPMLILWQQFTSTMVLILIAAAVISGFLGKPLETAAISAIVLLFAILGFLQEYRAERAMAALKQLAVPLVHVRRGGVVEERSARDLVPGDIVLVEAGAIIPADLRLIESANLRIQEATLTGESEPVEKHSMAFSESNLALGDRRNMAFMGTMVTYGRGAGVVVATGMHTELGRIAQLIQDVEQQTTPLQNKLDQVGKLLAALGVIIAGLIMVIGLLRGETLNEMFLTAVSIAVAVVPEGLPAVVTVTLALGAQRMLRRRALIRKLPAVETLGSVTVICSDKTGTLTENRMTVTVIDVAGHYLELVGTAQHPAPVLSDPERPTLNLDNQPLSVGLVLSGSALCNDASLKPDPETGRYLPVGDPTEGALLVAASQAGVDKPTLERVVPRIDELPFDSVRKRMTTVHQLPQNRAELPRSLHALEHLTEPYVAVTKGAIDGLLDTCDQVWFHDQAVTLD